jgi:hypothetical protein
MRLKSISSFIASVLLISFTIASGIIVYYFFTTLPKVQTTEVSGQASKVLSCAGATFDVKVKNCNLLNGLVLWLPMDEGSGTIAYDYSGYGNNGTLYNGSTICGGIDACPLWVDGVVGKAISFDGVDDYVRANTINVPYLTISAWVKWFTFFPDGTGHAIVSNSNYAADGYMLYQATGSPYNRIQAFVYTSSIVMLASNSLLDINKWYHVVLTYDGSYIKLYINGVLDKQVAQSGTIKTTTNPFLIGSTYTTTGAKFNGIIDEVMIFNRALSDDEIKQLYYNGLTNKFNITIGLLNSGYADLGNSFTAIVYLKNGTILQLPLNLDNNLSKGYYLEKTLTIDGYYPSYGLVDKIMVCSNDCQGVCSEIIVNNQC